VKPKEGKEIYVGRRYGDFARLQKSLQTELPGKVLPNLPRKIKSSTTSHHLGVGNDDDDSSISSVSTAADPPADDGNSLKVLIGRHRSPSVGSASPRRSSDSRREPTTLYREEQRVSLRAFMRTLLQNPQIARAKSIHEFLTKNPIQPTDDELEDICQRREMDKKRLAEQQQFYEIARQRAKELDVYMERFRRDIIESSKSTGINPPYLVWFAAAWQPGRI
jgi:hypothetical protein